MITTIINGVIVDAESIVKVHLQMKVQMYRKSIQRDGFSSSKAVEDDRVINIIREVLKELEERM